MKSEKEKMKSEKKYGKRKKEKSRKRVKKSEKKKREKDGEKKEEKRGKKEERKIEISKKMTIKELIDRYPECLEFFIDKRHFCITCPLSSIETLEDFCKSSGVDYKNFEKELEEFLKKKLVKSKK